jgi:hypothetical protein
MRSGSIAPGGSGLGLSGIEPQGSGHIVPRSAVRDGGAREPPGDSVERVDRGADRRQGPERLLFFGRGDRCDPSMRKERGSMPRN